MFQLLVSHNDDIKRLVEKGYAVGFDSNYLVVRDIPYLDEGKNLQIGAIVSKLDFVDKTRVKPHNHEVFFCGSHPHELDGKPIKNFGGGPKKLVLTSADLIVQRSFSNKPKTRGGFKDSFEKIESYVAIISGPAMELHNATPYTFRISEEVTETVFKYRDTLTSRAEISDLSSIFKDEVIAIIGLGGTGSYLLDLLAKTNLKEIRGFDVDEFQIHNAFRSPGKIEEKEFGKSKAEVYQERYSVFHSGIKMQAKFIQSDSFDDLEGVTFAFVCVDKGSARAEILNLLIKMQIPFIDVGMGLNRNKGPIEGTLRVTYFSTDRSQEEEGKKLIPMSDDPGDIYRNNIQIAELNALNACLAVIKYKQIRGFYVDDNKYFHLLATLQDFHFAGIKENE